MEELALAFGGQGEAVRLRDVAVHVPLDIGDGRAREDLGQNLEEVVPDLGARHVQHELLATLGPRPSRDADCPVGMRGEQITPLADHLGLDPQAEPKADPFDLSRQAVDAAGQLTPVGEPVPQ